MNLNKWTITFKIDTGADVTVIYTNYNKNGPLSTCNKQLSGPSRETLDVCGKFTGQLQRLCVYHTGYLCYLLPGHSTPGKASNRSLACSHIPKQDTNRY